MKKKNKNNWFMISTILFVVLIFVALIFLTNYEKKKTESMFPTSEDLEQAEVVGITDSFDYENQPSIGDDNAPVKVAMFGDYKCIHCKNWDNDIFPQLYKDYIQTGDVELHFINKQFLAIDSLLAGVAGEAVYRQDEKSFWEYHAGVYDKGQMFSAEAWGTPDRLLKIAKDTITNKNFDFEQLEKEIKEFKYLGEVKRDSQISDHYGVSGTPALFIGEKEVSAFDYQSIATQIDALLSENQKGSE